MQIHCIVVNLLFNAIAEGISCRNMLLEESFVHQDIP